MARPADVPPISKNILKLARQIDSAIEPDAIVAEPGEGCEAGRSYENVIAIVRQRGGRMVLGWTFREQVDAFVEAAFHAVWRCPDRGFIDVTPRTDERNWTFFLPDSRIEWEGEAAPPRRLMLHQQPCYCGSGLPFNLCHAIADD